MAVLGMPVRGDELRRYIVRCKCQGVSCHGWRYVNYHAHPAIGRIQRDPIGRWYVVV